MLDVEFVHAAAPGSARSLLSELRLPAASRSQARTNSRKAGHSKAVPGGTWLFALAGAENGPENQIIEALSREFRAAPPGESAGATFSRLFQSAKLQPASGPGTCAGVVVCGLCFNRAVVAHSGGSSCYLVRQNHATRLTLSNVNLIDYQVHPGDVLLLSGEVMHRTLTGSEMANVMGHRADLRVATNRLLQLTLEREPAREMTIAAIRILDVERPSQSRVYHAHVSR